MVLHLVGEKPGHHIVNADGHPVSGPWQSPYDAAVHLRYKGAGHSVVNWSGSEVVAA